VTDAARKAKRIAKLQRAWSAAEAERGRAQRFNNGPAIEAFGTIMQLIDACIIAEDNLDPAFERENAIAMNRLRAIAVDRDIFAHERETPAGEGGE
jgi:hypothetical protein